MRFFARGRRRCNDAAVERVEGGERRARAGNKARECVFFSLSLFALLPSLFRFSSSSSPSPPARSPSARSLALLRTLADMSRASAARSALRALAATATGAGAAVPVRKKGCLFFSSSMEFLRSLAAFALLASGSRDSLCSLASSQRGETAVFSRQSAALWSAPDHARAKRSRRGLPGLQKHEPEGEHARAFFFHCKGRVAFFFLLRRRRLLLSFSLPLFLIGPALSSSARAAARGLAQTLERGGGTRACVFWMFPAHRDSFNSMKKKKQALSVAAATTAAAAACCSFAASSSRLASFSAQPSRGFAAGASTTDLTSEIEHATGIERWGRMISRREREKLIPLLKKKREGRKRRRRGKRLAQPPLLTTTTTNKKTNKKTQRRAPRQGLGQGPLPRGLARRPLGHRRGPRRRDELVLRARRRRARLVRRLDHLVGHDPGGGGPEAAGRGRGVLCAQEGRGRRRAPLKLWSL